MVGLPPRIQRIFGGFRHGIQTDRRKFESTRKKSREKMTFF
jgi:hypothetical protein